MNDRLDFSIEGVKKSVENMREENNINKKNKESFLNYIDNDLSRNWNTTNGKIAVAELRSFVNVKFQEYIDYLDGKIDAIENVVIPALENIDRA